jgi:hypothetical protein
MRKMTFERAKTLYVHRFTMEHVPTWSRNSIDGKYYAPQFRTDREWYENTYFPGETGHLGVPGTPDCYTRNQSWPLGHWLDKPFKAV